MTKAGTTAQKIQDSLIQLAAEKPLEQIDLALLSSHAGFSIEDITSRYGCLDDIVWAFLARTTPQSLSVDEFSEDDTIHDKLFDLLMRRFESLSVHKRALRTITEKFESKDFKNLFVNTDIVRSMGWILETAGVGTSGLDGEARKRALAWVFVSTLEVFLNEEDAGLPKTMMALDKGLSRAALWQERFNTALSVVKGGGALLSSFIDNLRERRQKSEAGSAPETVEVEKSPKS